MNNHFQKWSKKHHKYLRNNYGIMKDSEIAKKLGRTIDSISGMAQVLGLRNIKINYQTAHIPPNQVLEMYLNNGSVSEIMEHFNSNRVTITEIINDLLEKKKICLVMYDDDPEDEMKTLRPIKDPLRFLEYANSMTVSHDNLAAKIPEHEILERI